MRSRSSARASIKSLEEPAAFRGECAFAVSAGKKCVLGKPDIRTARAGKKYVFSNPVAKFLWSVLPGRKAKAEANWSAR